MVESFPSTVSVVIPCYNGGSYLRQAIDSVLDQSVPPSEVLVIDDGSTDDSAEIAASYGPPVTVVRQENQGESVARNRGIDLACGAWIAFLDADDYWRPSKLEKQLAACGDGVIAVHTNYNFFGARSETVDMSQCPVAQRYDIERLCLLKNKSFNMSSLMVRRDASPRFPEWTRLGEDLIYYLDLLLGRAGRVELVAEDLVCTRRHVANQTSHSSVHLDWHRTIERWLTERRTQLDASLVESIQAGLIEKLAYEADVLYWQRDWPAFGALRRYLTRYSDHPSAQRITTRRVYPQWVYRVKDSLDAWAHAKS